MGRSSRSSSSGSCSSSDSVRKYKSASADKSYRSASSQNKHSITKSRSHKKNYVKKIRKLDASVFKLNKRTRRERSGCSEKYAKDFSVFRKNLKKRAGDKKVREADSAKYHRSDASKSSKKQRKEKRSKKYVYKRS